MARTNRGSEWRKWDLHVHSTHSAEPRAKLTVENIFKEAISKGISVVAIADHSNVNGLDEIWLVWENNSITLDGKTVKISDHIVFFPAVELKASCGKRGVHFIAMMPPIVNGAKVDKQFFTENILSKIDCTKANIIEAGKTDYNKGLFEIAVDLKKTSEVVHKFGGLISVHAFGKDHCFEDEIEHAKTKTPSHEDLLNALGEEKEILMKKYIDICELNNDSDKAQSQADFYLKNFSKPSIICSDSHDAYTNKYTWIKADSTFNGLKQILYEPEGRVCIQDNKPEDKFPYTVIDSVRFIDKRAKPEFSNEWIPLNQNLNAIIGGKSSGKSLLIYHIAKTIDEDRINRINKENGIHKPIEYRFEQDPSFDFEVRWADGENYTLKSNDKPNRPITFIPQLYLNRLAEDQKEELNTLVDSMLLDSSKEYRDFRRENDIVIDNVKSELFLVIENYYRIKRDLENKQKEYRELGDEKAVKNNINEIVSKIDELRKESEFNEEEEKNYKSLSDKKQNYLNKISEIELLETTLTSLKNGIINFKSDISKIIRAEINSKVPSLRTITKEDVRRKIEKIVSDIAIDVSTSLEKSIETYFSEIERIKKEKELLRVDLERIEKELLPLANKVKNRTAYAELQKRLASENNKLKSIQVKASEIKKLIGTLTSSPIIEKYKELFQCYLNILKENEKYRNVPDTEKLELLSKIVFSAQKFEENFLSKIDRRAALNEQFGDFFSKKGDYVFNIDNHINNIKNMIDRIISGQASLRQGFDEEHALLSLLDDYFSIDYNLLQDGDDLLRMSPGKRGIILFQLFLHLSKSTNPILIDQPEDNLDNRTVYQELNDFIKSKKIKRQIIIVSHNPNLVVSTDSENVIVANQDGQNKLGKNRAFRFEYVNGALENTFTDTTAKGVLYKYGIREHVCDILEGGPEAFEKRETKYGFKK